MGIRQHYSGHVTEVHKDTFFVRLRDVTRRERYATLEAEIERTKLPDNERPYIVEGAFFDWQIVKLPGNRKLVNRFRFDKRKWTAEEIRSARAKAKVLLAKIFKNNPDADSPA